LERSGVRWEYNMTRDPKEVGSAVVDQINLRIATHGELL